MVHSDVLSTRNKEHDLKYTNLQLIENLPVAIYTCDATGLIVDYNKAAADLWGRTPEPGKEYWCGSWHIYKKDGVAMPLDESPMAIVVKEGQAANAYEIVVERPDGTIRIVASHPRPLLDEAGKVTGAVNMLLDITEQKASEEKLAWMAAIVTSSDDAIISKTLNGKITSWNNAAERIFGYTADEVVGRQITQLIPADRLDEEAVIIERLKRGERVDHFQTQRLAKDNSLLEVSLTISAVKDADGNIIGASKIVRDITAEKRAERMIREEEERFRMVVESTKMGTWNYSPTTGDLNWSDECKRIYDVPESLAIDYDLFLKLLHPEDAAFVQQNVAGALDPSGPGTYDIQFRIIRYSDQQVRWIRSQGKVYFNTRHQPEKFIGTVLDITDEKMKKDWLEKIVMERTTELKKSNQELEQFAYVASHDLQEPLRKIMIFADKIKLRGEAILTEELTGYVDKITQSSGKMSVLIKDLLNYARANSTDLQFVAIDLNKVIQSVKDDLDLLILRKKATITIDPLPVIEAIPLQIHQLFFNLLSNSLKFTSEEKMPVINISSRPLINTEIMALDLDPDGVYHQFEFEDNGIGFSTEYSNQIFTIFQRLNTKEDFPGTGIGLALCKKVVEQHNGMIAAEGYENSGAKFTIVLPERQGQKQA